MAPSRTVSNSTSVTATRTLAGTGRRRPECAGFTASATGFDCARQHEHEFVGWVGVDRDGRARGKARAVDGPVGHRLGERHEFDARQKVDRQPRAGARIGEGLMVGHCGSSESW
jgi:hypothetical protein